MPTPTLLEVVYLVAIAHVWARGSIFKPFREHVLPELFDCPLCSGFWIGVLGHFLFHGLLVFRIGHLWQDAIVLLGVGSLVGTLSLAVYGAIRRL